MLRFFVEFNDAAVLQLCKGCLFFFYIAGKHLRRKKSFSSVFCAAVELRKRRIEWKKKRKLNSWYYFFHSARLCGFFSVSFPPVVCCCRRLCLLTKESKTACTFSLQKHKGTAVLLGIIFFSFCFFFFCTSICFALMASLEKYASFASLNTWNNWC